MEEKEIMKAKLSGIVALVGAGLAAIYTIIALIQFLPYIGELFQVPSVLILLILIIAGSVIGVIGAIRALLHKNLNSVILRAIAAGLFLVAVIMGARDILLILGLIILAGSIALDYLVK